jgi:hypothetical protein
MIKRALPWHDPIACADRGCAWRVRPLVCAAATLHEPGSSAVGGAIVPRPRVMPIERLADTDRAADGGPAAYSSHTSQRRGGVCAKVVQAHISPHQMARDV